MDGEAGVSLFFVASWRVLQDTFGKELYSYSCLSGGLAVPATARLTPQCCSVLGDGADRRRPVSPSVSCQTHVSELPQLTGPKGC